MANIHGHNVAVQQAAVVVEEGGGGLAAATACCLQLGAGGQARPAAIQWPLAARRHCGHGRKEEGQSFGATAQKRARREGDARGSVAGLRNTERSSPLRFPSQAARRERKKTKFLFGVYLSRVLCPDARRERKEEKTSPCPFPFSHKKRSGFVYRFFPSSGTRAGLAGFTSVNICCSFKLEGV